jgi:hypothetical protein
MRLGELFQKSRAHRLSILQKRQQVKSLILEEREKKETRKLYSSSSDSSDSNSIKKEKEGNVNTVVYNIFLLQNGHFFLHIFLLKQKWMRVKHHVVVGQTRTPPLLSFLRLKIKQKQPHREDETRK